jgi:hypothetical protein
MPSFGMLRHVVLVRTDVSKECIASILRVTRIGELGTTLRSVIRLLVTVNIHRSPILVTMMKEVIRSPKRRFLHEPHGVTSERTTFFTEYVCIMKTKN